MMLSRWTNKGVILALLLSVVGHAARAEQAQPKRYALIIGNNLSLDEDRLYVRACFVDEGLSIKRMHPTTQGRPRIVRRRSSHITVELAERARARAAGSRVTE